MAYQSHLPVRAEQSDSEIFSNSDQTIRGAVLLEYVILLSKDGIGIKMVMIRLCLLSDSHAVSTTTQLKTMNMDSDVSDSGDRPSRGEDMTKSDTVMLQQHTAVSQS